MLKVVDLCFVWFCFFLAFRIWSRDSRAQTPMLTVMHLKIYPDYREAFMTDSGNTPDTRVWKSPEMHRPVMTRAGEGEGTVEYRGMAINASALIFRQ